MRLTKRLCCFLALWLPVATAAVSGENGSGLPSFPGAEGYGAKSVGGRGGKVIKVTNLNPYGPGSLQWACNQDGPRVIVFEVSGVIKPPNKTGEGHWLNAWSATT